MSPDTINRGAHSPILLMFFSKFFLDRSLVFYCKKSSWSSELPSDNDELCYYGVPCSGFLWSLDVHSFVFTGGYVPYPPIDGVW